MKREDRGSMEMVRLHGEYNQHRRTGGSCTASVRRQGGLVMRRSAAAFLAFSVVAAMLAGCTGRQATVPTARVTRTDLTSAVSVSGNLEAPDNRSVAFTVPGTVEAVLVQKGDTVNQGDVLARLDDRDLQRNVELSRIQLDQARAQFNIADQQLRATVYPNYYGSYVVDVPGVWTALDNATDRVEQVRALIARGDVSEANAVLNRMLEDIDRARESSQARAWELPAQIKAMEYQREAASLAVTAAELSLQAARDMLDDATITAPTGGVITAVNVREGDVLTPATLTVSAFRVVDPAHLEMTGLIDEMDVAGITVGQEVVVTLDALPGIEVPGVVRFVSAAAFIQAGVVLYPTTISLMNPDPRVKDGMSATANIIVETRPNVLVVPTTAVFAEAGRSVVYLVGGDGTMTARDVTTGLRSGRFVEITSGLQEGDEVSLERPS
jgi:RND family efflux transporter MFP subunit